jgi:enoyl-CoA hydratase/carnithine racemase
MPSWSDILAELQKTGSPHDVVRRKYLAELSALTGRNTIIYYSAWLAKPGLQPQQVLAVNDNDKNGFMATIHKLDRKKGLDLVLHTPGGDTAATESLVDYLRAMFNTDIRAIVPQLAMSAGTMIACACDQIVMGRHSSLGPIDPQIGGIPAHGVIEEFLRAQTEVKANPALANTWAPILAKYPPAFIGECDKAIKWTNLLVEGWLETGMFRRRKNKTAAAKKVIDELANHALTFSHARHISAERARQLGLRVLSLERDQNLQDAVMSLHHACVQTLQDSGAVKLIENQDGVAFIQAIRPVAVPQ